MARVTETPRPLRAVVTASGSPSRTKIRHATGIASFLWNSTRYLFSRMRWLSRIWIWTRALLAASSTSCCVARRVASRNPAAAWSPPGPRPSSSGRWAGSSSRHWRRATLAPMAAASARTLRWSSRSRAAAAPSAVRFISRSPREVRLDFSKSRSALRT